MLLVATRTNTAALIDLFGLVVEEEGDKPNAMAQYCLIIVVFKLANNTLLLHSNIIINFGACVWQPDDKWQNSPPFYFYS